MPIITGDKTQSQVIQIIREKAEQRGLADLARETGINPKHIYTVLSDDGNPRLETLLKIIRALKLDIMIG